MKETTVDMSSTCAVLLVSLLAGCQPTLTGNPTEQIPIERIETLPRLPDDFGVRDWKQVARDLDDLVYNTELTGGEYLRRNEYDGDGIKTKLFPIIFFDKTHKDHPERVHFGIPTFLRDQSKQKGGHYEAVTVLPSLIGATLVGIDKSDQDGVNWVEGALDFYNDQSGQNIFLNNPGRNGGGGDSFWYTMYANVLFSKLHDLYRAQTDLNAPFLSTADTLVKLTDQLDGKLDGNFDIPWGYYDYQGWDFKAWAGNKGNRSEPEGACGAAYALYNAYKDTGKQTYLDAAESIMKLFDHPDAKNPTYEVMVGFGALTMARMNAELGKDYNLDRMLNWVFAGHSDFRPNWGMIASGSTWHGFNVDGLIGSTKDRGGYGFLCNTCAYLVSALPIAKYDARFARALGKWAVNAASALRYFYRYDESVIPGTNQYMATWLDRNDPNGCLAHDGIIRNDPKFPGRRPHVCGEPHNHKGWWGYDSDISMYSSDHIGEVAAMLDADTGVHGIIQWDLNVTDYYGANSNPTYLYYNPHPSPRTVTLNVGPNRVDIYDCVAGRMLKRRQRGASSFEMAADAASVIVLVPTGGRTEVDGHLLKVNGVTIDYRYASERTAPAARDMAGCVKILEAALNEGSLRQLAGDASHMMGPAKNEELLEAARNHELNIDVVAAYAQSAHKAVLASIEKELGLPGGFFRTAMRHVQFGESYGFIDKVPGSLAEKRALQQEIRYRLEGWLHTYRAKGGKALPIFPMLLTGNAQGRAATNEAEAHRFIKALVDEIPDWELKKRHAFITGLSQDQVPGLNPAKNSSLSDSPLINLDHLLNVLGSIHEGKLCISVYAENVPSEGAAVRYVPIHALGEGAFCVDDVARAVVALVHEQRVRGDKDLLAACNAGAEFLLGMQAADGKFYNFASLEDGTFAINMTGRTSRKGIGWWSTRAIWGLAAYFRLAITEAPARAARVKAALDRTIPLHERSLEQYGKYLDRDGLHLPRWLLNDAGDQTAILLNGLIAYYQGLPAGEGRNRIRILVEKFTDGLVAAQIKNPEAHDYGRFLHSIHDPTSSHLWGSQQLEVVAKAGAVLEKPQYIAAAKLCADNWWHNKTPDALTGGKEAETAYAIGSVTSGMAALHKATGEQKYADEAERWASWLVGDNGAKAIMYDPLSGRGYDGIDSVQTPQGRRFSVSVNSGAESTVEAILALQAIDHIPGAHNRLKRSVAAMLPR